MNEFYALVEVCPECDQYWLIKTSEYKDVIEEASYTRQPGFCPDHDCWCEYEIWEYPMDREKVEVIK